MNKNKLIIILSGLAIIIFAFFSMQLLSGFKKDPPKRPKIEIIRTVKAEPIQYSNLNTEIQASGRVNSKSDIVLSAEVSGKLLSGNVPFKKGQIFNKGDLLIKIYDTEASLTLKAKKSSFLNRIASVLPDFNISFNESYASWFEYFENINIDEDLPPLPEFKSTKEKVFLASRNLLSDFYSIKSDESRLKKYNIYAPFTGTFSQVNAEVGAIANPGAMLARIVNTIELELEIPLDIADAEWLKTGDKVIIQNGDKSTWDGKITRISKVVDEATQSISVYVDVKSTRQYPIYKGQYLTAVFKGIKISNVMKLPRNAVFNTNEVFTVEDSILVKREIDIKKYNEQTLYFSGITEGTDIVTEPLINVSEKTKVKILNRE